MRLIDADALVSALNNGRLKEQTGRAVPFNAGVAFALTMVEYAPTIDAVPRWIPCEERLPEKEEKAYLVYLDNGHVCECRWWCLDPVFLKPTDNWRWHLMDKPQYTKVLAWMPLPEPYGERKDDE